MLLQRGTSRRRRMALSTAAVAVFSLVVAASLSAAPSNVVATGHGTVPRLAPFSASFRFAAQGDASGAAHGFYTQTLASPDGPSIFGNFSGDVTCLEVFSDRTAVIGGVVTETTDPRFTAGWDFWVSVVDGRPTNTPDSTSLVELSNTPEIDFGPGFPMMTCNAPLLPPPPFALLTAGQINTVP